MPYLYAASSLPRCTLTMCCSEYLACQRSLGLLVRSTPAPPILKRVLGMSMERSLPEYQLSVMFSVETTRALLLGSPASSLWARPTAITPAEHPIPVTCDVQHAQYLNVVLCVKRCAQYPGGCDVCHSVCSVYEDCNMFPFTVLDASSKMG